MTGMLQDPTDMLQGSTDMHQSPTDTLQDLTDTLQLQLGSNSRPEVQTGRHPKWYGWMLMLAPYRSFSPLNRHQAGLALQVRLHSHTRPNSSP